MGDVNENKLYTVGKRNWLPTTYRLHFDNRKFARDTEYLNVQYDVTCRTMSPNRRRPSGTAWLIL